jgi:hypothetical protein
LKAETVQDANRWKLILEIRELCVYTDMLYSYVHPQLIEFHIEQRIGPMSYRYFGDAFNIDRPAVSTPFQPFLQNKRISIEIDVPLNDRIVKIFSRGF